MKPGILLFSLILAFAKASAQQGPQHSLHAAISNTVLAEVLPEPGKQPKKLLDLSNAKISTRLNPLTYLAAGLMFTYQNVISEQISANCSYQVSCSEYTKRSIEYHGLIKGSLIGLHQLTNCSPGAKYDHCEHAVSNENKILNHIE